jgi:hypothetical protein
MITLQFVTGGDLSSIAIEWFEHGEYSHVDCVMPDGMLCGARMVGGVAIRPADYLGSATTKRIAIPTTAGQEADYYAFLLAQVGKPYDMSDIFGFVSGRDWRQDDKWICSELQGAACETAKIFPWPLSTPTNKLTPSDLELALSVIVNVA